MNPNRGKFGYEGEGLERSPEFDADGAERGWNIGRADDRGPTGDDGDDAADPARDE
jgi:hypothetical protein